MKSIGVFIQDQILGMKWLNSLIGRLLGACGLDVTGRVVASIQFFIYDTVKIFVLLGFLIYHGIRKAVAPKRYGKYRKHLKNSPHSNSSEGF